MHLRLLGGYKGLDGLVDSPLENFVLTGTHQLHAQRGNPSTHKSRLVRITTTTIHNRSYENVKGLPHYNQSRLS
jgi:hypothetical protein